MMPETPLGRLAAALCLLFVISACTLFQRLATPTPPPAGPPPDATATAGATSPVTVEPAPTPTSTPTPEVETSPPLITCSAELCGAPAAWVHEPDGLRPLPLPAEAAIPYDIAAATGHLLFGSRFPDQGTGPGSLTATDLWFYDLRNGASRPLIPEEVVVEALWTPDGRNIAYVRAMETTYELRWLTPSGEDRLLAQDVAITFSVSPAGDRVAFTRESRYGMEVEPGLYVVDIASGEERRIAQADRAGFGSTSDQPDWSPDGSQIILPISGLDQPNALLRAAVDGSGSGVLTLAPDVEESMRDQNMSSAVLWHPDGVHLLGMLYPPMTQPGPQQIVRYGLSPALDQITSLEVIYTGDGQLAGWDQPGQSIWVKSPENQLTSLPLP